MNYEEKRKTLYKEALSFETANEYSDKFKRSFFELIEISIVNLLKGENNFFGNFMIKIKKEISFTIEWPIVTSAEMGGFKMKFNPLIILTCTEKEVIALLKHEIYHVMYGHYTREKAMKNKFSPLAVNIALDISINQYINNLPMFCKRLNDINMEYNLELENNLSVERYAEEIQKAINLQNKKRKVIKDNKLSFDINYESCHDGWNEDNLDKSALNELTKKVILSSYNGKAPKDLQEIILLLNKKSELNWQQLLKKVIPNVKMDYYKTTARRDRRQPDRLDIRGKLPSKIPEIILAIDISASMSDEEINKIMREVLAIVKSKSGKLTVIECDNAIRNIYRLKSIKDVQKRTNNNGSTAYSPVFEYMKKNNMKNNILIYFTDGEGEEELTVKPINKETIWVLTSDSDLSLKNPHGKIKRLKVNNKVDNLGGSSALEEMREVIQDRNADSVRLL